MTRAMKDSGIEWIGEIPVDWRVIKLRQLGNFTSSGIDKLINPEEPLVRIINYTDVYNNKDYVLKNKEYMVVSAPQDKVMQHQVNIGDLIFTPSSETVEDIGVSALVIETLPNTAFSYHVLRYTFNNEVYLGFKKYLCNNFYVYSSFSSKAKGTIRKTLSREDFKEQLVLLPPLPEQQKIADFLDEKCSHIDSVLEKVRASIDEYKQLKQSVITQAVTKGVRPNRPMKDSGIEWIGEIPQDWKVIKGKNVLELLSKPVKETDTVITCFRDGEVTLRSKRREDGFTISLQEIGYQGIDIGDLVVHGMDGFAGAIGISDSRGKGTPVLSVLDSKQNKKYLMYYLRAMAFNGVFIALATGIRVRSCDTSWNKLKNLPYPIPTEDEQVEIVAYLDDKCSKIDKLITKKEQLIVELETYKKSLIYEYVTGKKEVK